MTDLEEAPQRDILKTRNSIARSLREVEYLALDLHAQALASPNDRDFPGGTALHMLAPAAPLAKWEAGYEDVERAERFDETTGEDRWLRRNTDKPTSNWRDPAVYQGNSDEHPLNVLESWTRMIREDRDQPTSLAPTLSREVDYLRGQLDWATRVDTYGDPEWPLCFEMATELRTLIRRMEDVLKDGVRQERTETPCINADCDSKPRLIKVWSRTAAYDGYKCTGCALSYDQAQYLQAKAANLRSKNSEKWVLATDATEALAVPIQTMRSWIRRETVKTHWENGRLHVWWPDAREAAETRRMDALAKNLSKGA